MIEIGSADAATDWSEVLDLLHRVQQLEGHAEGLDHAVGVGVALRWVAHDGEPLKQLLS